MDVTPLIRVDQQVIQSYANGQFKVSGRVYESSLIVTADLLIEWPVKNTPDNLTIDDFEPLVKSGVGCDVVLLGCGAGMIFIPPAFKQQLLEMYGFALEAMDTGAACRTYNVLMAEGRQVAAALYPL